MKKLKVLIFVALLFVSCSNDDDTIQTQIKKNEVTVALNRFEVGQAKLFNDGTFNGVTEFEFYLTETGLNIDNNQNFSGNGSFLSLRLFSGNTSSLETGNYLYNDQDSNAFILNRGYHFLEYNASLGDNQSGDIDIESGSISVTLENEVYTITINLIDEDGNMVNGYYKGAVEEIL
ncbi:hypothetical protein [uncultured Lacinutrix sp.]|uniref:hypothetical protein n=1 Tax=uncultured Lacinutrix sp. TaxID=574032 RepID=UPI002609F271|nr:hypothetical protein [uncultured Lacinutrix sp.]